MQILRPLLCFVVLATFASTAIADAPPVRVDDAKELYREGETQFAVGKFLEAARLFERAYAISKRPKLLWNVAQAYRRQAEVDHDAAHLRRALAVLNNLTPDSPAEVKEVAALELSLRVAITEQERMAKARGIKDSEANAAGVAATSSRTASAELVGAPAPRKPASRKLAIGLGVGFSVVLVGVGVGLGVGLSSRTNDTWQRMASSCAAPCQALDLR